MGRSGAAAARPFGPLRATRAPAAAWRGSGGCPALSLTHSLSPCLSVSHSSPPQSRPLFLLHSLTLPGVPCPSLSPPPPAHLSLPAPLSLPRTPPPPPPPLSSPTHPPLTSAGRFRYLPPSLPPSAGRSLSAVSHTGTRLSHTQVLTQVNHYPEQLGFMLLPLPQHQSERVAPCLYRCLHGPTAGRNRSRLLPVDSTAAASLDPTRPPPPSMSLGHEVLMPRYGHLAGPPQARLQRRLSSPSPSASLSPGIAESRVAQGRSGFLGRRWDQARRRDRGTLRLLVAVAGSLLLLRTLTHGYTNRARNRSSPGPRPNSPATGPASSSALPPCLPPPPAQTSRAPSSRRHHQQSGECICMRNM